LTGRLKISAKALGIRIKLFGDNSLEAADSFHDLGVTLLMRGDFNEAWNYLQESLRIKNFQKPDDTICLQLIHIFSLGNFIIKPDE